MLQRFRFLWSGKTLVDQKRFTETSDGAYEFRDTYEHAPVILMDKQYAFFNLELASLQANQFVSCEYAKDSSMLTERKVEPSGATWGYTHSISATGVLSNTIEIIDAKEGTPTSFKSVQVNIAPENPGEMEELAGHVSTILGSEVTAKELESTSESTGYFSHDEGSESDINFPGWPPKLELHIRIPETYFTSVWQAVFSNQRGWDKATLGFQAECFVGDRGWKDLYAMKNNSFSSAFFEYFNLYPVNSLIGSDES